MSVLPLNRRFRPPAAAGTVACVSGLLAVAGLVMTLVQDSSGALSGHAVEDAFTATVWAALGALLARHASSRRFVVPFLVVSVAAATAVAAGAVALDPGRPESAFAAWVGSWAWVASTFVPITVLPAWFPDGPAGSRVWAGRLGVVGMAIMAAGLATASRLELNPTASVANPLATPVSDLLFVGGGLVVVTSGLVAVTGLTRNLLASTGERRRQLAPVVVAVWMTIPALAVAGLAQQWGYVIQLVVTPLIPASIAVALLRHRLYNVEFVVRRSLVFLGLTAFVLGGYVLIVQAVANVLDRTARLPESIIAVGLVALAFQPARAGLQRVVGRWVYGERDTPGPAIADLGHVLSASSDPDEALRLGIERLRVALRVGWVEVRTASTPPTVAGGRPPWLDDDLITAVPLVHLGIDCGSLRVAARGPRDLLTARDRSLVQDLAGPLAAVVAARQHVADLQRSREAAVIAREEERRRVRRDLHDGIGPLLSAIATHADVVGLRAGSDPAPVPALVERIQQLSVDAVTGMRRVIDDLQPVGLDELGLDGALAEVGADLALQSGADVRVTAAGPLSLSAAVELAVYRIATEALNNAVRHADATRVDVRLGVVAERVILEVADDGCGIAADATAGVGMGSMRERATELGGTLHVTSGPSGTTIVAEIPRHDGAAT
ncbi:sensor histidine kinase [Flexivirga alba]|uniref:histidine kinase n=1 Tax=Flexivirga alba TaxID=702742 RepID=A0ABW2AHE7_9MICO